MDAETVGIAVGVVTLGVTIYVAVITILADRGPATASGSPSTRGRAPPTRPRSSRPAVRSPSSPSIPPAAAGAHRPDPNP